MKAVLDWFGGLSWKKKALVVFGLMVLVGMAYNATPAGRQNLENIDATATAVGVQAAVGATQIASTVEAASAAAKATDEVRAAETAAAPTLPPTEPPPTEDASAKGMTMAMYEALETGMTAEEAGKVIGQAPCKELSSNEIAGYKTVSMQCDGAEFASNAILMFQNGKLISKSQFGLK